MKEYEPFYIESILCSNLKMKITSKDRPKLSQIRTEMDIREHNSHSNKMFLCHTPEHARKNISQPCLGIDFTPLIMLVNQVVFHVLCSQFLNECKFYLFFFLIYNSLFNYLWYNKYNMVITNNILIRNFNI